MSEIPHEQLLGQGNNPFEYLGLIDNPSSEGYQIRTQVIFPTLFRLMREVLGDTYTPFVDFGSGTGSLTAELSKSLGLLAEGVDESKRFVRLAAATYPHIPFHGMQGAMPVAYNMHNAQAHLVLHCTPKPKVLLEQIADALEPNGYAFITIPNPEYFKAAYVLRHPEKQAHVVTVGNKAKMTYYPRTIEEHESLFTQAGFKIRRKQVCYAQPNAPAILEKYKHEPRFIMYALQKQTDIIDTAFITLPGSGKIMLLTRVADDDKFPGAKSFFSVRRRDTTLDGRKNLAEALQARLGIRAGYISQTPLGSLYAKHRHADKVQHAHVHLHAVKLQSPPSVVHNKYFAKSEFIEPDALRPFGGACTQLGYEFLRSHA
jgi:SAM-dependent methyltransferase